MTSKHVHAPVGGPSNQPCKAESDTHFATLLVHYDFCMQSIFNSKQVHLYNKSIILPR